MADPQTQQELIEVLQEAGLSDLAAKQAISRLPAQSDFWSEIVWSRWFDNTVRVYTPVPEAKSIRGTVLAMAANREIRERREQEADIARTEREWWARQEQLEQLVRARQQQLVRARQQQEVARQRQIAERLGQLEPLAPSEEQVAASFLEQARGVSPAFQEVTERRLLPDIFQELGMTQRRRQWWETGVRQIAEQLLPETEQEKELMALKRADPWAQLLKQPTFLQQLETRFRGLPPAEKGVSMGRFRPRTRFLS